MKALHVSSILCLALAPTANAQIFVDGFEAGRTCWVWSATVGGLELCYDAPHGLPPPVSEEIVDASTEIARTDVIIGLDTTGSMGGEIANLKSSITSLIDAVNGSATDSAFAVAGYDDFPCCGYGSAADGDKAFYLLHRVMTATTPDGIASLVSAVDQYETHSGLDSPESGWEMVFQVATGLGNGTGSNSVAPFDPATAPPVSIPAGEEVGEFGGVGIRPASLPVVVWITDAESHNSSVNGNLYGTIPGVIPADSSGALYQLNVLGGRIVGVMSHEAARTDLEWGVSSTGASVDPSAWGVDDRPPGCGTLQCCTGLNGAGVSPSGVGNCPLLFEIASDGSGLGTAVADGIDRLVNSGVFDIGAVLIDYPFDPVNVVTEFVDRIEADVNAPLPCAQGLTAIDVNPMDGVPDTFVDVEPGTVVCFTVVLKANQTIPSTGTSQVFGAHFEVIADSVTILETRSVFFRVPP